MSRKSRLTTLAACFAALILIVDTAAWWLVTNRMEEELAAWRQARTDDGFVAQAGLPQRAGWPFRGELILPDVTLATEIPGQPNAVAWQTAEVRLVYALWHPDSLDLRVGGAQTVRIGAAPPVEIGVTRLDARIPLDAQGQAQGFAVTAAGLSFPSAGGQVRIAAASARIRAMDAFVSVTDAVLPGANMPFGGAIASLDLHARSTGPIPLLRDPAAALTAWRTHGQPLVIDDLALRWGPLDVRGSASLGLDAAMQPEGSASVQLTGFTEVIEALARSGAITRNDARVASTLLGLMSRPGASDVAEADLPVTLKNRTLLVGAIPLLRIPALVVP